MRWNSAHGLVVVGRHRQLPGAEERGEPGAGHGLRVVGGVLPGSGAVAIMADDVGQVLHERRAGRDGHDLHAAADAEHRHPPLPRGTGERELPGVAVVSWLLRGVVGRGSVAARLDVGTTRDDEGVETREHGIRHVVVGVEARREDDADGARPLEVVDVAVRQHDAVLLHPRRPVDVLDVRRDADDRPGPAHVGHGLRAG